MSGLLDVIRGFICKMFNLIWFGKKRISNSLSIYIKTYTGSTLSIELDPKWDIGEVKEILAPRMGMSPEDIKIIFAGKELSNSTVIEECDLGQQSILHAVRTPRRKLIGNESMNETIDELNESSESGGKPLNETLSDLPLDESFSDKDTSIASVPEKSRAHFYVFCSSPCNAVEHGKLRVRCEVCGSGAVTVDRDPQCWPDVLLPKRITVNCENPQCIAPESTSDETYQVHYAQFYFKCAKHTSLGEKDEAVPLYLIKPNLGKVPCLACTDVKDTVLVFTCEEAHVTCLDCFRDYCMARLRERQFVFDESSGYYTLPCPAGCPNSYIQEIHHFHLLDAQQYAQYQRFGAEEYVLKEGGILCPQPDCGMGIIPPPIVEGHEEECRKIQCIGGCGYVFCRVCLQGYHTGSCEVPPSPSASMNTPFGYVVDPRKAKDAKYDDATNKTIRISTKPCPKCRTPTERDGGCMHMDCTRGGCGYQWCWVCQTEWTRECMGSHWFG